MSKKIHSPHDKFFKKALANKEIAKEFFQQHLPKEIQAVLDFNSLEFCKESFIDANLKSSAADVLYKASFNGEIGYIYALAEHQSTIDNLMPFRDLKYKVSIAQYHLDHVDSTTLPVIYTMVFYTGQGEYTGPLDLFELFGAHKDLARSTFFQPLQLVDVNKVPDAELQAYLCGGIMQFIMKHRLARDFSNYLEAIFRWVRELEKLDNPTFYDFLRIVIKYIVDQTEVDPKRIIEVADYCLISELKGELMTAAEQLRQEGYRQAMTAAEQLRQEGYKQAMVAAEQLKQEGLQQGLERIYATATRLLRLGQTVDFVAEITELSKEEVLRLQKSNQAVVS